VATVKNVATVKRMKFVMEYLMMTAFNFIMLIYL